MCFAASGRLAMWQQVMKAKSVQHRHPAMGNRIGTGESLNLL
jgi:hypothetical protein